MSERVESLLVVSTDRPMKEETRQLLVKQLTPIAESMDMKPLVLSDGLQADVHSDIRPVLESILTEQQKTNSLLLALVEAMAADEPDPDAAPRTYLDGTPVR
ncbi:hypothetical protein D9M68_764050 [compost metagenome]